MTDRDIENRLKAAVERTAPDGLPRLLSDLDREKGVVNMENTAVQNKKKRFRWAGLVAACLVVAVFAGLGGFWYGQNRTVATVVSLDVNPSIELRVSRAERVLRCDPLNAEAREVLSSMGAGRDLEGAKLDVAVNAIVGAIVRAGYLDSLGSAILISVDDRDAARGARLQAQLVATVDGVLKTAENAANVMSQNVTTDSKTADRAQEYGISTGKAAYIEQVLALNPGLDYAKLAALSVEELRDLIRIGAPAMPIGRDAAGRAAEEYAGVDALDSYLPQYTEVDPEIDDPTPHYDVEINYLGREYEYEIDAFTGEVLRGQSQIVGDTPGGSVPEGPALTADEAFNAAAKYFSEKHPELIGNFLNIENRYDREDGCYEIEFWCAGWEFDYDVDGRTGQVLREETDYRYTPAASTPPATEPPATTPPTTPPATTPTTPPATTPTTPPSTTPTTPPVTEPPATEPPATEPPATNPPVTEPSQPSVTDIGAQAAKDAALKHAGLTESQVTFLKAARDYDDGRLVYDVDFLTADAEYDYEIDAATGAVLKHEVERRSTVPPATTPTTPPTTEPPATEPPATTPPATEPVRPSVTDIGADAAKDAALKRAGIADAASVTWLKCQREYDDGRLEYEIEFVTDTAEYEITVSAADGTILKYESEGRRSTPAASGDIGAQAAKDAALAHAGLTESQVTRLKCERDFDDGRVEYEVEFKYGGWEYEYKIDAATGAILEHDRDRDD